MAKRKLKMTREAKRRRARYRAKKRKKGSGFLTELIFGKNTLIFFRIGNNFHNRETKDMKV